MVSFSKIEFTRKLTFYFQNLFQSIYHIYNLLLYLGEETFYGYEFSYDPLSTPSREINYVDHDSTAPNTNQRKINMYDNATGDQNDILIDEEYEYIYPEKSSHYGIKKNATAKQSLFYLIIHFVFHFLKVFINRLLI